MILLIHLSTFLTTTVALSEQEAFGEKKTTLMRLYIQFRLGSICTYGTVGQIDQEP